jgi:hypothetical protein
VCTDVLYGDVLYMRRIMSYRTHFLPLHSLKKVCKSACFTTASFLLFPALSLLRILPPLPIPHLGFSSVYSSKRFKDMEEECILRTVNPHSNTQSTQNVV